MSRTAREQSDLENEMEHLLQTLENFAKRWGKEALEGLLKALKK